MKKETILTLIMPSFNVAPYIKECMESALNQTLSSMEILCVDACSEDGTYEILKEYEAKALKGEWPGKTVEVIKSEKRSYGYQVNLGIKKASGKYMAILETDDFVEGSMYEKLVVLSEEMNLDYIRGEYHFFTTNKDGSRTFKHVHHYAPVNEMLYDTRTELIMTFDQNLWKGIYLTDFIVKNNIKLNESAGAAFQDIGFNMQVFSYAKRAYYVEESFYRYRRDREDSSINSLNCFKFYTDELKFLHELDPEYKKLYWPGIYERFSCALCGEYNKAVKHFKLSSDSKYLAPYIPYLSAEFEGAIKKGLWPASSTPEGQVKAVKKVMEGYYKETESNI